MPLDPGSWFVIASYAIKCLITYALHQCFTDCKIVSLTGFLVLVKAYLI
jgi:hypothetical protein